MPGAETGSREMSRSSRSSDDDGPRTAHSTTRTSAPPAADPEQTPPELRLKVVENDDGPDRGTIYPRGLTGIERMETWISVDAAAVVELSAWR